MPKDDVMLVEVTDKTDATISDDPDLVSFTLAPLTNPVPDTTKGEMVSDRPPSRGEIPVMVGTVGVGVATSFRLK
jgi:hypothetical protein